MSSRYYSGSRLSPGAVEVVGLGKYYQDKSGWLRWLSSRFGDKEFDADEPTADVEPPAAPIATANWALKDITFSVKPGDRLAILGPAAAGKSTLIQVLAGHLAPSEGVVEGAGIAIPLSAVALPILPNRSGYENLLLVAQLLRIPRERVSQNVDKIAEFSELGSHLHKEARKYSKSMFQQFGLAMALHVDPDILLIDEGIGVRNVGFYYKAINRITELLERGTSLIFAASKEGQVREWCRRGLILSSGRVAFDGGIEEACRRHFPAPAVAEQATLASVVPVAKFDVA
jgi:ABC-type polysaccharide/polyol phosphate transport system ATPase subunit